MPGSTLVQGFPYPFQTEAGTPVSAQNLATEVDVELTAADAIRVLALNRPSAQATRASGSQSVPINVATVLTYDTESWDTGTLYAPGTPNRLTIVTTGTYQISGSFSALLAAETDTVYEAQIGVSGTAVALNKKGQYNNLGDADDRWCSISILYRLTAAQFVDLRCFWTGPAGTSRNIAFATLSARLVAL